MQTYTGTDASGQSVRWQDNKRRLWLASVLFPLQPFIGIGIHALGGHELWLLLPFVLNYLIAPLADIMLGADSNNPPEAVVKQLDQDRYYRYLTYAIVPCHFFALLVVVAYAATAELSVFGFFSLAVVSGMTGGLAINSAHELGHKMSPIEKRLARIALALTGYAHFTIDHNRGHHRDVATPEDPASSRMGESFYRFVGREIPGSLRRAWRIEAERLRARGKPAAHPANIIVQNAALSLVFIALLVLLFGLAMLPFMLLHNAVAWLQLSSANYIEHYGLLRQIDERGRRERCAPRHSWNCNRLFSNLALFQLERHSDHHAHPQRRYQSLRHYDDVPQLPTGYFGCYVLAYLPPLWFHIMDRRLLALPHVGGDLQQLNVEPSRRAALKHRYGSPLPDAGSA